MANYTLVDVDKLEGYLKTVADSIRSKAGKTGKLKFPDEFKSVVEGIVLGVTVQKKSGTVTMQHEQKVTTNCGFKPDVVFLKAGSYIEDGITYNSSMAMVFPEESRNQPFTPMYISGGVAEVFWTQATTGFSVKAYMYDWNWDKLEGESVSCEYVAIKYTN